MVAFGVFDLAINHDRRLSVKVRGGGVRGANLFFGELF